jgi:hypothetical protein
LKNKISDKLKNSSNSNDSVYKDFIGIAQKYDCPVLTTNFDLTLEEVNGLIYNRIKKNDFSKGNGFSSYYPWDAYFGVNGTATLKLPTDGFGIWHIHGMTKYLDSIRMGLTDYMGGVEKARKLIHNDDDSLFRGKDQDRWEGRTSWLHIWFNMPLIIVGLKLTSSEVFIRWLLIERERYFKKLGEERRKPTKFICKNLDENISNFIVNLKIKAETTDDYGKLYC